ncbi:unnamed protein product [Linum tenue]|uniref:Uncharacterized protein n=1 Tax=Linum tenue TaxID=586396 RepID=A0AAV0JMG4_9ROSI|nr:unnamed protein product [Linum tenue]
MNRERKEDTSFPERGTVGFHGRDGQISSSIFGFEIGVRMASSAGPLWLAWPWKWAVGRSKLTPNSSSRRSWAGRRNLELLRTEA